MADGSYRIIGGAPAPDAARVAQLAQDLKPAADFAADQDAAAADALTRLEVLCRARGADCGDLIADIRGRLDRLAPQGLVPRRGLAGLFDGPGKRLKAFRAAFNDGATALSGLAADLRERIGAVDQRTGKLDALGDELRGAITALSEQVAAARDRLTREDPEAETTLAFRERIQALETRLTAAVQALPLVRALQNADARARDAIAQAPAVIEAWQADWKTHLGLDRKRPRKVRPAPDALLPARERIESALSRMETEQGAADRRRQEIAARLG